MTHAVCTPGQRPVHHLYWTLNPLLELYTGIEVVALGTLPRFELKARRVDDRRQQ